MAGNGRYFTPHKGRKSIDKKIIFLCEGIDDAYFLDEICNSLDINESDLGIVYVEGNCNFSENIISLTKSSHFTTGTIERIFIFHDIDREGEQISDLILFLTRNGFPKLIINSIHSFDWLGISRKIGIFAIGNEGKGALEDLVLLTCMHEGRYQRATDALNGQISETGPLTHFTKRISQIYLSLFPTHWRGAGRAFKAGVFPHDHEAFKEIKTFIANATS